MSMLHLDADLELDLADPHSLAIRYPGSLRLSQTFGRSLASVHVGGDLVIDTPEVNGIVVAAGEITTHSPVEASRIVGRSLKLESGVIRCAAIAASDKIVIGKCTLKVDVIIAPVIEIHPEAKGRVTVIESGNDRGSTKIKGGFTLVEYEELFGDGGEFLSDRHVAPLGEPLPDLADLPVVHDLGAEHLEEVDPLPTVDDLTETAADDDSYEGVALTLDNSDLVNEPRPEAQPAVQNAATIDDEDSEIIKENRPVLPRAPTPQPPPKRKRKKKPTAAVNKWFDRFDHVLEQVFELVDEPPEPLTELKTYAQDRQVDGIKRRLDDAWLGTLRHHRQSRTAVDAKVAHRFRVLSDLVTQGPGSKKK